MPDQSGHDPSGHPRSYTAVTTPSVPAASTNFQNITGQDVMVYLTGGTGVAVTIDGISTGLASGSFRLRDTGTINLGAYSVAPTWHWIAH